MKICLITRSLPVHRSGGMETITWDLACGLSRGGHGVHILTTAHPKGRDFEKFENISVHYLSGTKPSQYTPFFFPLLNKAIRRLHEEEDFDILHSQGFAGLTFKPPANLPMIISPHGTLFSETPLYRKQFGKYSFVEKARMVWRHRWRLAMYPFYQRYLKRASLILADSRFSYDELRRDRSDIGDKLRFLPLGVDVARIPQPERFLARQRLGLPPEKIILFTLSRLEEMKGVDVALQAAAAAREKDFEYIIGGEGRWRGRLEKMAQTLGLKQVFFPGRIPGDKIHDYLAAADLFIYPELGQPAFGLVSIESLAHGTPVLASAAGATPEIVKPEVGWLFKRGDTTHLAEQLRSILPHLPEWRKRADYLRRYVEQNFPLEIYLEQTIQTYREAAASR